MTNYFINEKEEYSKPKLISFQSIVILILCFTLCVSVKPAIDNIIIMHEQYHYSEYLKKLEQQKNENGLGYISNINSDFLGWLEVDDVGLSLPIVKTDSKQKENYYLSHDFKKDKNSLGCPYQVYNMDLQGNNTMFIGHSSYTTTIMGHTNNQNLFGKLNTYLTPSNNFNYKIKLETESKTYTYKIFSSFKFRITDTTSEKYQDIFKNIFSNKIETKQDFNNFISCIQKYSVINCQDGLNFGDKILTLFTCYSNLDYRTMIIAKQI